MSNSIGGGISMRDSSALSGVTQNTGEALSSFTATMDTSSTKDLMRMTQLQNQWSIAVQAESSFMKTISDTLKGIIQKLG
jgi:type III secretion protein F